MSEAKYKVGDEVTIRQLRKPHKIEAVKEQYYIRDEGWHDAHDLTPYVRPLEVGDRVRRKRDHDAGGIVRHIEDDEACYFARSGAGLVVCDLDELERIPTEAGK